MLGTLLTVGMLAGCPLCEAKPVVPEVPAPVVLIGATEAGEVVTLEVFEDGSVVTGDPTPIVWPEGWEGRHISNLSTVRQELFGSRVEWIVGYDHHSESIMVFEEGVPQVSSARSIEAEGTNTHRGFAVSALLTMYVLDTDFDSVDVIGQDGKTVPIVRLEGLSVIEAIEFGPDGALYALGDSDGHHSRGLYTISLHTGEASLVARLPVTDLDALTMASDGCLYSTDANGKESHLYRIDPVTGVCRDLGGVGVVGITALTERPRETEVVARPRLPGTVVKPSR